ncbi:TPA: peptidase M23 [Escherichia coli]
MIISPPILHAHIDTEKDSDWVNRMMSVDPERNFPMNSGRSWHGGVHLNGNLSETVRCIADGKVISIRQPEPAENTVPPLNYNGVTDKGYVLIKHETEIGSGEEGKIVYYSLYMHLRSIDSNVQPGNTLYRKEPVGAAGMVDGQNAFHFQIFCDDENIQKITGRISPETDLNKDGRTDVVYGDSHFYLPAGTPIYGDMPEENSLANNSPVQRTSVPLYVTMSFDTGNCTMVTRQQHEVLSDTYTEVGSPLINADGKDYEYNLYSYALQLYPKSPSAGYEMLRFGRVVNTEYEELVPADAPLWRTINTPQGKGVVNLGARDIRVYSDGDFPHWTGWKLVNDDADTNSQCNSPTILCTTRNDLSRMICHFPLEWDSATVESRFEWLKSPNDVLSKPMTEPDLDLLIEHCKALCLVDNPLPARRVWHFDPRQFIAHFRKCGWLGENDIISVVRRYQNAYPMTSELTRPLSKDTLIERITSQGQNSSGEVIRPAGLKNELSKSLRKYLITTPLRIAHYFGQMARETGRFASFIENGDSSYFDMYEPGTEQGLKLGNNVVGDGARFKGRGTIHLTGRENYRNYGKYRNPSDDDFFTTEPNNQLPVENAYFSCDAGGYFWASKQKYIMVSHRLTPSGSLGVNYWADKGCSLSDAREVTRRINPAADGFDLVRWPAFEHSWYVLNDEITPPLNYIRIL